VSNPMDDATHPGILRTYSRLQLPSHQCCCAADSQEPLLVLGAVHFKHVTDVAWSHDGATLVATSHDGYCTIARFAPGELGVPLKDASGVCAAALRQEIARKRAEQVRVLLRLRWPCCLACVCGLPGQWTACVQGCARASLA
jgi:hypothetical protein